MANSSTIAQAPSTVTGLMRAEPNPVEKRRPTPRLHMPLVAILPRRDALEQFRRNESTPPTIYTGKTYWTQELAKLNALNADMLRISAQETRAQENPEVHAERVKAAKAALSKNWAQFYH